MYVLVVFEFYELLLPREFLRAGSDVMQAFTFYASEDKLTDRGNTAGKTIGLTYFNFTRFFSFFPPAGCVD